MFGESYLKIKPTFKEQPRQFRAKIVAQSYAFDSLFYELSDNRVRTVHVLFDALDFTQMFLERLSESPPIRAVPAVIAHDY